MPQYIYKCPICKKEKEINHKIDENPLLICDNCQKVESKKYKDGPKMNRIIQPVNFKISGYYTSKTGYAKNKEYMKAVERKKRAERKRNG